jgi:AcrR family transcriptional regulator
MKSALKQATAHAPALRQRMRETTVQAILTAAEEVFAGKGLHGAHMGEIASLAGVAVGTLYNHFADRDALLAGLLEARRAELLARVDVTMRDKTIGARPFRERLRALLAAVLSHKQAHRKFFHILMQGEIGRYQETFPAACNVPLATMRELFARVDKLMKQGVREKALRADVADLAPVLFMGMVRAVTIRDAFLQDRDGDGDRGGGGGDRAGDLLAEGDRLLSLFLEGAGR